MAEVIWSETAVTETDRILDVIGLDNESAAIHLGHRIRHVTMRLGDFPNMGRMVPEIMNPLYREMVVPPVRVIYKMEVDQVIILPVLRSEQLFRNPEHASEPEESYLHPTRSTP